jgi:hypothetical protein
MEIIKSKRVALDVLVTSFSSNGWEYAAVRTLLLVAEIMAVYWMDVSCGPDTLPSMEVAHLAA